MATFLSSTTARECFPRNRLRRSLVIQNEDSVIDCYLKRERDAVPTVSSTDHDHRIAAGGALALNWETDGKEAIQDRWTVVAASGTPRISWFETEEVER